MLLTPICIFTPESWSKYFSLTRGLLSLKLMLCVSVQRFSHCCIMEPVLTTGFFHTAFQKTAISSFLKVNNMRKVRHFTGVHTWDLIPEITDLNLPLAAVLWKNKLHRPAVISLDMFCQVTACKGKREAERNLYMYTGIKIARSSL